MGGLGVLLKPTHVPENPMSGSFRHLRKQTQSYRPEKILGGELTAGGEDVAAAVGTDISLDTGFKKNVDPSINGGLIGGLIIGSWKRVKRD